MPDIIIVFFKLPNPTHSVSPIFGGQKQTKKNPETPQNPKTQQNKKPNATTQQWNTTINLIQTKE